MPDKKLLIFLGIMNGAGYLLQYVGMPYTTAAKAALFINLSAMWVAILSPKLLGEKISSIKVVGVLLGVTGIIFVSTNLDFVSLTGGQLSADLLLIISGHYLGPLYGLQQETGNEFHIANLPEHDMGANFYILVNCAFRCFVWTRLFFFNSLGLGGNNLDSNSLLDYTLLYVA